MAVWKHVYVGVMLGVKLQSRLLLWFCFCDAISTHDVKVSFET
jgi:hypothetical protein